MFQDLIQFGLVQGFASQHIELGEIVPVLAQPSEHAVFVLFDVLAFFEIGLDHQIVFAEFSMALVFCVPQTAEPRATVQAFQVAGVVKIYFQDPGRDTHGITLVI